MENEKGADKHQLSTGRRARCWTRGGIQATQAIYPHNANALLDYSL